MLLQCKKLKNKNQLESYMIIIVIINNIIIIRQWMESEFHEEVFDTFVACLVLALNVCNWEFMQIAVNLFISISALSNLAATTPEFKFVVQIWEPVPTSNILRSPLL